MVINNERLAEKLNESESNPSRFIYIWQILERNLPATLIQIVQEISQR